MKCEEKVHGVNWNTEFMDRYMEKEKVKYRQDVLEDSIYKGKVNVTILKKWNVKRRVSWINEFPDRCGKEVIKGKMF